MEMSGYGYRASAGESAASIARSVYGDEKYAAELLCANPELGGRVKMTGGEMWKLPVIAISRNVDMIVPVKAPWKEE